MASYIFTIINLNNNYIKFWVISGDQLPYIHKYYFLMPSRVPPYLVGLLFGILYKEFKFYSQNISNNSIFSTPIFIFLRKTLLKRPFISYFMYLIGLVLTVFIIFIPRKLELDENYWSYTTNVIFITFSKIIFTLGIILLILPSILEIPNFIFKLLSTKIFIFLGKISFSMYLIQEIIINQQFYNLKEKIYFNDMFIIIQFFGTYIISIILGLLLNIFIEAPSGHLDKAILSRIFQFYDIRKFQKN